MVSFVNAYWVSVRVHPPRFSSRSITVAVLLTITWTILRFRSGSGVMWNWGPPKWGPQNGDPASLFSRGFPKFYDTGSTVRVAFLHGEEPGYEARWGGTFSLWTTILGGNRLGERASVSLLFRGEMSQWRFYKLGCGERQGLLNKAPCTQILYQYCTMIGGFIYIACCTESSRGMHLLCSLT